MSACFIKSLKYCNTFFFIAESNEEIVSSSVLKSCCPLAIYLVFRVVFLLLSCKRAYSIFLSFLRRAFKVFPDASLPIKEIKAVFIFNEFKFLITFPAPPSII